MTRRQTPAPVRARLAALLTAAVLSVVAGCAPPPLEGVDGDLADGWAGFDTPTVFVPANGVCHRSEAVSGSAQRYEPVDCDRLHRVETVHVGTFTGADAELTIVPAPATPTRVSARAECDTRSAEFLGQPLQHGRLTLRVVVPTQQAWNAGARWFRCDLAEISSVFLGQVVPRTGSLRGALTGEAPLALGCHEPIWDSSDYLEAIDPVACSEPHYSEFVGAYAESDAFDYDDFNVADDVVHERCLQLIARYAALPVDDDLPQRVGTLYFEPSRQEWVDGDRQVRCFLYLWDYYPPLTRSARNGGPDLLPVVS
ncbi:septum formation family protein [Solwaraspora sp. WMMD791]|uniref:septum formation family protein n=1 Tax=Solwaraspora sp. WMMD791 TaxID=3016086 RepID=UPI00249C6619|nr:septum formation family protein [Solwaraspora sp. WMMD791]WFE28835.1 septum formation family protein [Solwaraspora sp. WMMD791]